MTKFALTYHRTPPRRQPRVAAMIPTGRTFAVVVADPWEIRAVALYANIASTCRLLIREAPVAVVTTGPPPVWLKRLRVPLRRMRPPEIRVGGSNVPELRRFSSPRAARLVATAVKLADLLIIQMTHDRNTSQDRSSPADRP